MKSRRDSRSLQTFQLELKNPADAEAILSVSRAHKQGLFSRWKSFELQFRSGSVIIAKISDTRPKIVRLRPNVSSVENATHIKDAQIEKKATKVC